MDIAPSTLESITDRLLGLLDREHITCLNELENRIGAVFRFDDKDLVAVELTPSNNGTAACTLSYIRPGVGVPIELKLNRVLMYSVIVIKFKGIAEGYAPLTTDLYNNLIQVKRLHHVNLGKLKDELRSLKDYLHTSVN